MKLNEMKVGDIISLPLFKEKMADCLRELEDHRDSLIRKYGKHNLKRTPMDRLVEDNVFNADSMTALYSKVLVKDKTTNRSASEREFIRMIGDEALHRTVVQIKTEEEYQEKHNKENENES